MRRDETSESAGTASNEMYGLLYLKDQRMEWLWFFKGIPSFGLFVKCLLVAITRRWDVNFNRWIATIMN